MEIDTWNRRYKENETVYGTKPNVFFKSFIDTHKQGALLLPAEGEGRNAIYAASKGWEVDAFDFSVKAKEKALQQASQKQLKIQYQTLNIVDFHPEKQYDAVALIFVHLPEVIRREFHQKVSKALAPGGYVVLEAFAKEQLGNQSGGPKDIALLYDAPTICDDFKFLHILYCGQKEAVLDEGLFHKGKADVLQLIAQKI
jgi:SAM-dependent methyltransferase